MIHTPPDDTLLLQMIPSPSRWFTIEEVNFGFFGFSISYICRLVEK
jgi:hypothetical protein